MISSHEYVRKAIHLLNLVIPLSYWHIFPNKSDFLKILFGLTCLFLFIDVIRSRFPFIKIFFIKIFGKMLRNHEIKGKFTGATWVMIASLLTISLFPKNIAILSLIFMSLGDTFAALVGRKFGKVTFFNKTFEGFLGGLFPCIIIAFYFNSLPFYISLIGAFSAMLIEVVPIPIDDNLSIPVFSASAMTISSGII